MNNTIRDASRDAFLRACFQKAFGRNPTEQEAAPYKETWDAAWVACCTKILHELEITGQHPAYKLVYSKIFRGEK